MKKDRNKYKIVVFSDLKDSSNATVKSTVSLAKMINGQIDFFHVKKANEIVAVENQLSAIRTINDQQLKVINKIQKIIKPISEEYDVKINYAFSFGNVKNEINKYIKEHQPDIIVLGKRKSKTLSFIGDGITKFVLKKHDGVVMISANLNALEPNEHISMGVINDLDQAFNYEFAETLIGNTQEPLKSFHIVKNSDKSKKKASMTNKKTVEYVFEQGGNTIKNLSKYLSKNNINLLCIDRIKKEEKNKTNLLESDFNEVLNNLNVSLLIAAKGSALPTETIFEKSENKI